MASVVAFLPAFPLSASGFPALVFSIIFAAFSPVSAVLVPGDSKSLSCVRGEKRPCY